MIDHLWYFVSRGEPDGPSGHVVVCPGPVVAVGMDGSDVPGGCEMQATGMFTPGRSG